MQKLIKNFIDKDAEFLFVAAHLLLESLTDSTLGPELAPLK